MIQKIWGKEFLSESIAYSSKTVETKYIKGKMANIKRSEPKSIGMNYIYWDLFIYFLSILHVLG